MPPARRFGASSNLPGEMKAWSEQQRIAIVAGWSRSTDDQVTYARSVGVSPRTLRCWATRYGSGPRPVARALAIVRHAVEQLQALQAALEMETESSSWAVDDAAAVALPIRRAGAPEPDLDLTALLEGARAEVACRPAPPSTSIDGADRDGPGPDEQADADAACRPAEPAHAAVEVADAPAEMPAPDRHAEPAERRARLSMRHAEPAPVVAEQVPRNDRTELVDRSDLAAGESDAPEPRPVAMPNPWRPPGGFFASY